LTAFTRDAAFPASVRGPVDRCALARLAASFAGETGTLPDPEPADATAGDAGDAGDGDDGGDAGDAGDGGDADGEPARSAFGATMGELLPGRRAGRKRV
jgi:hypothetical protein